MEVGCRNSFTASTFPSSGKISSVLMWWPRKSRLSTPNCDLTTLMTFPYSAKWSNKSLRWCWCCSGVSLAMSIYYQCTHTRMVCRKWLGRWNFEMSGPHFLVQRAFWQNVTVQKVLVVIAVFWTSSGWIGIRWYTCRALTKSIFKKIFPWRLAEKLCMWLRQHVQFHSPWNISPAVPHTATIHSPLETLQCSRWGLPYCSTSSFNPRRQYYNPKFQAIRNDPTEIQNDAIHIWLVWLSVMTLFQK